MKIKTIALLPLMVLSLTLSGCDRNNGGSGGGQEYTYATPIPGPHTFDDYYKDTDLTVTGGNLLYNLHVLSILKHRTGIRYSQFNTYTRDSTSPRSIDESAVDHSKNVFCYTGKLVSKSTGYTREHVWPCANSNGLWVHDKGSANYVDSATYIGGGSDLYHVRPCDSDVNTARGNSKFVEFKSTDTVYASNDGGPYTLLVDKDPREGFANRSEPANEVKGDLARILMYVYTRYNKFGDYNDQYCGNLALTNVFGYSTPEECAEIMCKWNAIDPVDATELLRNDTIEAIQGNRNPFVDHPELMAACFGLY